MSIKFSQILSSILLSTLLPFSNAIAADDAAEFAIRWNPRDGGPKTGTEVIQQLQLPPTDDTEQYKVSYFSVAAPVDLPSGYSVIARQRTKGKKTQLTIKYRGATPLPDTFVDTWQCPLGVDAKIKYEVDIAFLPNAEVKKAYSLSCSIKTKEDIAFPSELNAKPVGCESKMLRYESDDIKIEEWTFYPDEEKLIEVSKSARDNKHDLDEFNTNVASRLILSGINPLISSKSAASIDCVK